MHFSVLLIHEMDEDFIMAKRYYDATEDDGAHIEFQVDLTKKQVMAEYKKAIGKKGAYTKEKYPTLNDYMEAEYSHLDADDDGNYGYNSNTNGMYDWHEIGGRWSGCLPTCKNEKELKALLEKALDLKNKEVKEKYRDKVEEYVKISEMPLREACAYLNIGGQDSLVISNDFSAKNIIDWFKNIGRGHRNDDNEPNDAVHSLFNSMIIEEDGMEEEYLDGHEDINEKFFTEKYNELLKKSKKEGREFQITVLDLHT